ncbi:hypothetical protein BTI_458 [Burkholderia thailandensis MSMB121]|uniref:hypothetical protein n=1 Tax=Burkholderia humptydooensis TaxID=430531 RepID=UPI000327FA0A|nr:hypothetical protein [Burkholderia humptydooensis]AGK47159.1 hypothetical protein BTI_458 [Burkholderia thailandensis MSMB121]ATF35664.1 hypothetical protein CO709_21370 [Burkholderia thailandensis]
MSDKKNVGHEHVVEARADSPSDVWDKLVADGKERKEAILAEHFPKAFERFRAGVSLARIRANYEKLGAKYSPATFRKKWGALVRKHTAQV